MSNSTLLHSLIYIYMLLKGLKIFQTSHNAIDIAATNVYHTAKQWHCKMLIYSLETLNQCFCEVGQHGQKSVIRDSQNVDL